MGSGKEIQPAGPLRLSGAPFRLAERSTVASLDSEASRSLDFPNLLSLRNEENEVSGELTHERSHRV